MRRLIAEAKSSQMLSSEGAEKLSDIPNIKQVAVRLGNWLTRDQAKEILATPDRSKLKGKRDYVILSLLVACALRRTELAELDVATTQQREGRWVLADLEGKGRRVRTVVIPIWVKQGIDAWTTAANIKEGELLRSIKKGGKIDGALLSDFFAVGMQVVDVVPVTALALRCKAVGVYGWWSAHGWISVSGSSK